MSAANGKGASAARLASLEERTAYARAFEAILWALPVANTLAPRRAGNERGIPSSALFITEQRPTGKLWLVTCNAESPYVFGDLTTTDGPIVFEVPPADKRAKFSGSIVDLWWLPLEDIGPEGADAGKGGKYLVLPPGYQGLIPAGYIVLRSRTYRINQLFRAVPGEKGDAGWAAAVAYAKKLRVYALADSAAPKPAPLVDVSRGAFPGTPTFDRTFFRHIDQLVQEEPVLEHDKAMMGMLAHLGFAKGKPFRPDERLARILDRAAQDVQRYCVDMLETERSVMTGSKFWPNRQWVLPGVGRDVVAGGAQWLFPDRLDYITRASFYYSGIGVQKHFGAMSIYPLTTLDSKGNPLDGGKHYRLHLPKDVPANDFWELIAYSPITRSFIDTPANRIAVSSKNPSYETNDDGSIDVDIGPDAPTGRENNWISTRPGEPIKVCLRFYGPQQRLLEKQWTPGDLEEVA